MKSGELWAYRKRAVDPLEPIRVIRRGTTRPKWLFVRFEAPEAEGLEAWVPEGRLKAEWNSRYEFRRVEELWAAVKVPSRSASEAEKWAVDTVVEVADCSNLVYSRVVVDGVFTIEQPGALADRLMVTVDELRQHQLSFEEDGLLVVPWPTTKWIAQTLAPRNASGLFQSFKRAAEAREHRDHLVKARRERLSAWEMEEDEKVRQGEDTIRRWCGLGAVSLWGELAETRQEVARLNELLDVAIGKLEKYGHAKSVATMNRYRAQSPGPIP